MIAHEVLMETREEADATVRRYFPSASVVREERSSYWSVAQDRIAFDEASEDGGVSLVFLRRSEPFTILRLYSDKASMVFRDDRPFLAFPTKTLRSILTVERTRLFGPLVPRILEVYSHMPQFAVLVSPDGDNKLFVIDERQLDAGMRAFSRRS